VHIEETFVPLGQYLVGRPGTPRLAEKGTSFPLPRLEYPLFGRHSTLATPDRYLASIAAIVCAVHTVSTYLRCLCNRKLWCSAQRDERSGAIVAGFCSIRATLWSTTAIVAQGKTIDIPTHKIPASHENRFPILRLSFRNTSQPFAKSLHHRARSVRYRDNGQYVTETTGRARPISDHLVESKNSSQHNQSKKAHRNG
jgi:hypothetical protein